MSKEDLLEDPKRCVGRKVSKRFDGEMYGGVVDHVSNTDPKACGGVWWRIVYDDGDSEDVDVDELLTIIQDEDPPLNVSPVKGGCQAGRKRVRPAPH
eukprot:CAMPEP_0177614952 /NCGR_PEP_ID=MMETSP0419_2-20121207/23090_1 /TAXON_ID=582737 /ORGANISM="Tetraselmis sp., Strain GSL018" /LENGTH=96 /DNA_ID=CAMNT_0019112365 /DNA_START=59 /DNA_END=346 /DNA_ORIENTATION=+